LSEAALAPSAPHLALSCDEVRALVLDSVSSPHSKRAYSRALEHFARWAKEEGQGTAFGKALIQRYRSRLEENGLAPSSMNVQLAALRKLAMEAADNGLLDPAVASAIGRVKGSMQKGRRIGRWLTREEASLLLRDSGDERLKAKRDRALLCLLLGAGLRREELVSLEVAHIQPRDGRWVIADLIGKRQRIRTVPIPAWSKAAIDHWTAAAAIAEGKLFRAVDKPAASAAKNFSRRLSTWSSASEQRKSGSSSPLTTSGHVPSASRRSLAVHRRGAGGWSTDRLSIVTCSIRLSMST
jgi:site-specific recombinase XerC